MCCTTEPSRMSQTIVYGAEILQDGAIKHVMAYQNNAENLGTGPNAMLLPIPSAHPLDATAALDLTAAPRLLKDYAEWFQPRSRGMKSYGYRGDDADELHVFNTGSYTVVLAQNAAAIPSALSRVPTNRRPAVKQAIFDAYAQFYPGWSVALACYDGTIEAEPIGFVYEPRDLSTLFLPGLDGHDGQPPRLGTKVERDHTLIWASASMKNGSRIARSNPVPAHLAPYFPDMAGGRKLSGNTPNGDFHVDISRMSGERPFVDPVKVVAPGA